MSVSPDRRPLHRRPFLMALAGSAAAITGIGVAARTGDRSGAPARGAEGLLQLAGGAMGVQALEVRLDGDVLTAVGPDRWQSARLTTTTHSMVGFSWLRGEEQPHIEISSRVGGVWGAWQRMPHAHEAAAPGTDEQTAVVGTDPAWVGAADGIRLQVRGARPAGFTLVLLYPTALPGDHAIGGHASSAQPGMILASSTSDTETEDPTVPRPDLLTRSEWGADESWRDSAPQYNDTIVQVHVHHTANSNDYTKEQVPALIRGMYAYHTQSLGWSDIGYNFLVDRFGRIWVGRAGGPGRPVRGAHTLGFNALSTGVAAIGNYDVATPTRTVLDAIARVAAWKLHKYGRDPMGTTTVESEGSDKFRAGREVTLPVIDGHRDTNDTACPGRNLYAALPAVRRRTRDRMERFTQPRVVQITEPFTASGATVDGQLLTVSPGAWTPAEAAPTYTWMRDGAVIEGAAEAAYQLTSADVGATVSVRVDVAAPDHEPASQTLTLPDPVKAQAVMELRAVGRRRRAVVRVAVSAAGLAGPVTGPVTIKIAGRRRTVELVDGQARAVFRKVPPGTYTARAAYEGNESTAPTRATDSAVVKPAA